MTTRAGAAGIDLLHDPGEPVQVVDVGANPIDGAPPYGPLLTAGIAVVTGFEPQPSAYAQLTAMADDQHRYLPYAVGDGSPQLLRVCAESGFTSIFEPDAQQLALLTDFARMAAVHDRMEVQTRRLDDVEEIDRIDLLKIDIQGGELQVFRSGRRRLAEAVAVHTEVGFARLYEGAPTFADVDLELRAQGFIPHCFVHTKTWPLAPVQWADPLQSSARQLVEADVLYVRDLARLDLLSDLQLRQLGLICDAAYGSHGVALLCVRELVRRSVVQPDAAESYRHAALAAAGHRAGSAG